MPQKIDRIGRSHEWGTRHFLLKTTESKKDFDKYLNMLEEKDQQRVLLASQKTAEKIIALNRGRKIKSARIIGEENKKQGSGDYDLSVKFDDGEKKEYSLKTQTNSKGINVRNPSMNSICVGLADKSFENMMVKEEYSEYLSKGNLYSRGKLESKELGNWGAKILAERLNDELEKNSKILIKNTCREIRYETNLIITIVNNKNKFLGYSTGFSKAFEKAIKNPEKIKIIQRGIAVYFYYDEIPLFHIDIYMMSDSKGKGKKLRAAIRVDFELDK